MFSCGYLYAMFGVILTFNIINLMILAKQLRGAVQDFIHLPGSHLAVPVYNLPAYELRTNL